VAEAVERAVAPDARKARPAGKPQAPPPVILALLPRAQVAGEDGDALGEIHSPPLPRLEYFSSFL
jgi:hypothetical protein